MIQIERKKLDLMQSMGNGREDWDTTYHFLTSLWEPVKRLPEDRQMFLHVKIQEMIFQETQKQKGTQSSTFISNAALSVRGRKIESRRKRPILDSPIILPDFQRVTTVLYSKLLVFPLSNIPHFVVGSLSLPYLSSR